MDISSCTRFFKSNNKLTTSVACTILEWLDRVLSLLAAICLVAIVADVMAGVISRYVFNKPILWTDSAGQCLWIYLIFLGITLAHRKRRHIQLDILKRHLPPHYHVVHSFLIEIIVAYTIISMLFYSIDLISIVGGVDVMLSMPNWIRYAAIPITAAAGLVYLALRGFEEKTNPYLGPAAIIVAGLLFYLSTMYIVGLIKISPSLIMVIVFLTTLLFGVPVAFAMLLSAFLAILGGELLPSPAVVQNIVTGSSSFLLLAIPMFILTGELMNMGGLTDRLYDFGAALVGNAKGGLAQVNVIQSFFFGGLSGSSASDAALDSKILIPQMVRFGYPKDFSCAITAASAVVVNIIPPSISMLVFASITGASVIRLFIGGILPGTLLTGLLMTMVYILSRRRGYGSSGTRSSFKRVAKAFFKAIPVLGLVIVILFGLRFGFFTPTEAAGVAVVYASIVGGVIYRKFEWRNLYESLVTVATEASIIGFLVGVGLPFTFVLFTEEVPQALVQLVLGHTANPTIIFILIMLVGLLLGTFLDLMVSMVILVPLVYPLITHIGIDPIHFGVTITVCLLYGALTPPYGILVFISAQMTNTPAEDVFREVLPFLFVMVIGLFIMVFFPPVVLALVHWLI